jgi:nucleoside 2-deoxyribosyltransferase
MDSGKPTCFLSFPEDPQSTAAADALRADLEERGVTVLPPARDDVTASSFNRPFYWLRQADAVVLDVTGDSTWVVYDAGAAQALDKLVIPVAQPTDDRSRIRLQLPRILEYEPGSIDSLADYVTTAVMRILSAKL